MHSIPNSYQLYTAEQCRTLDSQTIEEFGIDSFTLMEVAGTKAADIIRNYIPAKSRGLFFCGKGNNAGDALVVARLLSQADYKITLCFLAGTENLSSDADRNLKLLQKLEADIHFEAWPEAATQNFDFVIDGIFGTGLKSVLRPPYADVVKWINQQTKTIFSLDVPSGLDATAGTVYGEAVKADYTLTFGALKTGFYLNKGFEYSGKVLLCDLPFPNKFRDSKTYLIVPEWVKAESPAPHKKEHKYDGGVVYIIAGSEGLTGAAVMAAKSAWSSGAGAVFLVAPKGLLNIYESQLVQVIKYPVGTADDTCFKLSHLEDVKSILSTKSGSLIIGPGLGRREETMSFVRAILEIWKGRAVIDADGLYALSKVQSWKKPESAEWILTPHPGEAKHLFKDEHSDDFERMNVIKKMSAEKNCTILSKGMPAILATSKGRTFITGYDTRIFSRAGFGDVLAGKIGCKLLETKLSELAVITALTDGYKKASEQISKNLLPEPLNII